MVSLVRIKSWSVEFLISQTDAHLGQFTAGFEIGNGQRRERDWQDEHKNENKGEHKSLQSFILLQSNHMHGQTKTPPPVVESYSWPNGQFAKESVQTDLVHRS